MMLRSLIHLPTTCQAAAWLSLLTCANTFAVERDLAKDIAKSLCSRNTHLSALHVVYVEEPRDSAAGVEGGYTRREVAAKAPGLFFRDNSHGHQRMPWDEDPLRKTLHVSTLQR